MKYIIFFLTILFSSFSFAENLEEPLNIDQTFQYSSQFSLDNVSSLDDEISQITRTPTNDSYDLERTNESVTLREYMNLYVESQHNARSLEILSKFCVNANHNEANVRIDECLTGNLHPDAKSIKHMLDSIEFHFERLQECNDNYRLSESDIKDGTYQDYFDQNSGTKDFSSLNCSDYGNIVEGEVLVRELPLAVEEEGSSNYINVKTINNHDLVPCDNPMLYKRYASCDDRNNTTSYSGDNIESIFKDKITPFCNELEHVMNVLNWDSWQYTEYCDSYLNKNFAEEVFYPLYLGDQDFSEADDMEDVFSGSTRSYENSNWFDDFTTFAYRDGIWFSYTGDNNQYRQNNISLRSISEGGPDHRARSYFDYAETDFLKTRSDGEPDIIRIPDHFSLNSLSYDLIELYNNYFNADYSTICPDNNNINHEKDVQYKTNIFPNESVFSDMVAGSPSDVSLVSVRESEYEIVNLSSSFGLPYVMVLYNHINDPKVTKEYDICNII